MTTRIRITYGIVCIVASLVLSPFARGDGLEKRANSTKVHVGVYDSRAIALAYAGSELHDEYVGRLMQDYEKAKVEGNKKRLKELEAEGKARQNVLHKQVFGTAPVDDILEHIKDKLSEVAGKAGVGAIVSKWDKKTLRKYRGAEFVDVTMFLARAFNPNEKQLRRAEAIQERRPLPLFLVNIITKIFGKGH